MATASTEPVATLGFLSVPSGERDGQSLVLGQNRRSVVQEVGG